MFQMLKKRLKDQKGFTLIELLAVIVILGILAAIAVPSIMGLIDNTKKDAHVANAQQMIASAKMAVANNAELQTGTKVLTLEYLASAKYIEDIKDPDSNNSYVTTIPATLPTLATTETGVSDKAYVVVTDGKVTKVKLVGTVRGIQTAATGGASIDVTIRDLSRTDVH